MKIVLQEDDLLEAVVAFLKNAGFTVDENNVEFSQQEGGDEFMATVDIATYVAKPVSAEPEQATGNKPVTRRKRRSKEQIAADLAVEKTEHVPTEVKAEEPEPVKVREDIPPFEVDEPVKAKEPVSSGLFKQAPQPSIDLAALEALEEDSVEVEVEKEVAPAMAGQSLFTKRPA
jgi:hypothetical protein